MTSSDGKASEERSSSAEKKTSHGVAFMFSYNLIVGTGALALPFAVHDAGLLLSALFIAIIGFLSWICVTYVIEALAITNAALRIQKMIMRGGAESVNESVGLLQAVGSIDEFEEPKRIRAVALPDEQLDLFQSPEKLYDIDVASEMGMMSQTFFGPKGKLAFYACLIIYLYGDLAIYAVVVPKSMAALFGGISFLGLNAHDSYYVYLVFFGLISCPLVFFDLKKTTFLQILTLGIRIMAFLLMVILGFIFVGSGEGASLSNIPLFNFKYLPQLYGVAVYSFMCHHSLTSFVTPIANKQGLSRLYFLVDCAVYSSYMLLSISSVFAFGDMSMESCFNYPSHACSIQAPYTLNFTSYDVQFIAYFLNLYPVFICWTNYPIIACTLRNNLFQFFEGGEAKRLQDRKGWKRYLFPVLASVPPIGLALLTRDMELLVNITGSFPGLGIEFVIPTLLVVFGRRYALQNFPEHFHDKNPHTSPFRHRVWLYILTAWVVVSIGFNTYNLISSP